MARRNIFRKEALDKLQAPEKLESMLVVERPRHWITLGAVALLILAAASWGVWGSIPVRVRGRGVLVQAAAITPLQAASGGRVLRVYAHEGDQVEAGQVLLEVGRPPSELGSAAETRRWALLRWADEIAALEAGSQGGADPSTARGRLPSLEHLVRERAAMVDGLRQDLDTAWDARRDNLERQRVSLGRLAVLYSDQRQTERQLASLGAATRQGGDEADARYQQVTVELAQVDNQILDLPTDRAAAQTRLDSAEAELAELRLALARERSIAQSGSVPEDVAASRLGAVLDEVSAHARVVAPARGRILELSVTAGQVIQEGAQVGVLYKDGAATAADGSLDGIAMLTIADGKRVTVGMATLISPDSVPRQRYGSVRARLVKVVPFPVTPAALAAEVGSPALASELRDGGRLIEVHAEMVPEPGASALPSWTASAGPGFDLTAGTTFDLYVEVERRRPVTYVVPFLRALVAE